jgi:hypothetical protein
MMERAIFEGTAPPQTYDQYESQLRRKKTQAEILSYYLPRPMILMAGGIEMRPPDLIKVGNTPVYPYKTSNVMGALGGDSSRALPAVVGLLLEAMNATFDDIHLIAVPEWLYRVLKTVQYPYLSDSPEPVILGYKLNISATDTIHLVLKRDLPASDEP